MAESEIPQAKDEVPDPRPLAADEIAPEQLDIVAGGTQSICNSLCAGG